MSVAPLVIAGALAAGYVVLEARGAYIDYRLLVLRVAALLICLGAAFALDDPTEDTLAHVPTPLLLRRLLRVVLVVPPALFSWFVCIKLVGPEPKLMGGPIPMDDITLEATAVFLITMAAASLGAIVASDRLGGIVAAPILFVLAAVVLFLPPDHRLIVGDPAEDRWVPAHEAWRNVLLVAGVAFLYWNRDRGGPRILRLSLSDRSARSASNPSASSSARPTPIRSHRKHP